MKIKQWIAVKQLKLMLFMEKAKKEALKLAFAVVIAEVIGVIILFYGVRYDLFAFLQPKTVIITNAKADVITKEAKTDQNEEEKLADFIWNKESSRKNNYSKCEAIGKVNMIGYGIDGTGKYICFNSHEDEMKVLIGFILAHEAQGMTRLQILKHYTPSYTE